MAPPFRSRDLFPRPVRELFTRIERSRSGLAVAQVRGLIRRRDVECLRDDIIVTIACLDVVLDERAQIVNESPGWSAVSKSSDSAKK
ncbi:hypothetical protein [Ilumatobacter nonamiensis]|uniref:hypothetical protein n=1 Tax=Ilumatobacter nonamiensis TaxID=467093 RepID=UPI000590247F|nr:hypothetical protein [Ilumatobacter nonamiensis]